MKHLTQAQLNGVLDDALPARDRAEAERHLESCAACRDALAALAGQDEALRAAIVHDPGEAYFEAFADRVQERIARGAAAAPRRRGFAPLGWLRTPRGMAWAGGVAAIVIAAGIVLVTARETPVPSLLKYGIEERARQAEGERPAPEGPPGRAMQPPIEDDSAAERRGEAPGTEPGVVADREVEYLMTQPGDVPEAPDALQAVPEAKAPARAGRQVEARRDARGEELPVRGQGFAPVPPPTAATERPSTLVKPGARPLEVQEADAAKKSREEEATHVRGLRADESEVRAEGEAPAAPPPAEAPEARSKAGAAEPSRAVAPAPTPAPEPARDGRLPRASLSVRDEAGSARLCGRVRDAAGRPVVAAQVALAELGRTSVTDERGDFCLDAPPGDYTLSVLAVGFEPARVQARVPAPGASAEPVAVSLTAVPVLEGVAKALDAARRAGTGGEAKAFAGWPALSRALAQKAALQSERAAETRSAAQFDAAAADWERVLARSGGGAGELEARRRLAEARYLAWGLEPTPARARAAVEALTAFAARAPAGAARDSAARWLDRVKQ